MNSLTGKIILFVLAGIAAGLFTWIVSDGSGFIRLSDSVGTLSRQEATYYQIIFMAWGGAIGVLLGVADALTSGSPPQWLKIVGFGLLVGILSGVIGGAFGMAFFGPLYVSHARTPVDFLRNVLARGIGWAFIGALAGTAPGWRKLSFRVGRNGFIGGLLGGLLGGTTFEIIPYLLVGFTRPGPISRLFGFVITGAMIGLFVALVHELLKEAWIRVVVGRNEGKEILIEKVETRIGRAELSDVPLFGDPQIARTHAVLVAQPDGRYILRDTGESTLGVFLNGERIPGERPVRSGDQIQVGGRTLVFYERQTRTRTAPAPKDIAPTPRPTPAMTGGAGLPSLSELPAPGEQGYSGMGASSGFAVSSAYGGSPAGRGSELATSSARLIATSGPHTGAAFTLHPGATLGRDPGADVALPADSKASRIHARIVSDGTGYAIEDAGSTNGTFVNGQRITRQPLVTGDAVLIGTTSLRFE